MNPRSLGRRSRCSTIRIGAGLTGYPFRLLSGNDDDPLRISLDEIAQRMGILAPRGNARLATRLAPRGGCPDTCGCWRVIP